MPSSSKNFQLGMAIVLGIALIFAQIGKGETRRSNGLIKRCGSDAREFLKWFCDDDSFNFPFPFHRVYIILRYRAPYKHLYPFQHQASTCCRYGCPERGYERMCHYHKMMQGCKKFSRNYRTSYGRRKHSRMMTLCR